MKILVTGASGFIGGNLTEKLIEKKFNVSVLIRKKSRKGKLNHKKINFYYGDIANPEVVEKALEGIDVVFNCAALLPYHRASQKQYLGANVEGVKNIIRAAKKNNTRRLIHLSTVGIYGNNPKIGANENSQVRPYDMYSKTKLEAEIIIKKEIKKGLPAVIIKPTIAYGPGDIRPVFLSLFKAVSKPYFVSIGNGDNYLHTIYIDNLVEAMLRASSKKSALGKDFIIGDDPCPKFSQILSQIAKLQGKKLNNFNVPITVALAVGVVGNVLQRLKFNPPLTTPRVKFMTSDRKYDISKSIEVLGFKPKIMLSEGLKNTFDWYNSQNLL